MADLMQQARKLLPCPFCGNTVQDDEGCFQSAGFRPHSTAVWSVRCGNPSCNADVSGTSADDAVDAWNRRPALRAAPEDSGVVNQSLTTGWQPIETAPKDGEIILIADIDDHHVMIREGRWEEATGKWSWPWICGLTPKLWMPIPPLAARPQGVKDGR